MTGIKLTNSRRESELFIMAYNGEVYRHQSMTTQADWPGSSQVESADLQRRDALTRGSRLSQNSRVSMKQTLMPHYIGPFTLSGGCIF